MFRRILDAIASDRTAYIVAVSMFGIGAFLKINPVTMMVYGYLVSKYSYILGQRNENRKAIEIYEPTLEAAKADIDSKIKEIAEANRQISIMKEKLGEYEKLS